MVLVRSDCITQNTVQPVVYNDPNYYQMKESYGGVNQSERCVVAFNISGTVKWFNVKRGYGFVKRNDVNQDIFIHQTSIKKNNPKKYLKSVDDGEIIEFDILQTRKGLEAINVTGPNNAAVRGSRYAPNRFNTSLSSRKPIYVTRRRRSRSLSAGPVKEKAHLEDSSVVFTKENNGTLTVTRSYKNSTANVKQPVTSNYQSDSDLPVLQNVEFRDHFLRTLQNSYINGYKAAQLKLKPVYHSSSEITISAIRNSKILYNEICQSMVKDGIATKLSVNVPSGHNQNHSQSHNQSQTTNVTSNLPIQNGRYVYNHDTGHQILIVNDKQYEKFVKNGQFTPTYGTVYKGSKNDNINSTLSSSKKNMSVQAGISKHQKTISPDSAVKMGSSVNTSSRASAEYNDR
ncbi:Cold shock-like protein CspC [Intoshia linei]|uniref:Cold shock-like protein CspC n=1 Tax=Intoshia linei TaxID=1819745 RepID=A0A177B9E1_9BILA|nr:Cold shock-like protein CspC [Intoshia linei]